MAEELGKRLLRARLNRAAQLGRPISQTEVGRELGVTGVSVGRWEAGTKEPDLETLRRLAQFYVVRAGWLAFGEEAGEVPGSRELDDALRIAEEVERADAHADERTTGRADDAEAGKPGKAG